MPQSAVDIALVWDSDQLPQGPDQGRQEDPQDDRQARVWAAGTELSREMQGDVSLALVSVHSVDTIARPVHSYITLPPSPQPICFFGTHEVTVRGQSSMLVILLRDGFWGYEGI